MKKRGTDLNELKEVINGTKKQKKKKEELSLLELNSLSDKMRLFYSNNLRIVKETESLETWNSLIAKHKGIEGDLKDFLLSMIMALHKAKQIRMERLMELSGERKSVENYMEAMISESRLEGAVAMLFSVLESKK